MLKSVEFVFVFVFSLLLEGQSRQSRDLFVLGFSKAKQAKQRIIFSCSYQCKVENCFSSINKTKQRLIFSCFSKAKEAKQAKQRLIVTSFQKSKVGKVETYSNLFLAKQSRQSRDFYWFLVKQSRQSRDLFFLVFSKAKQAKQRLIFTCFYKGKVDKVEK